MSQRIQLRLTVPAGTSLHDYLSEYAAGEQRYELLRLASNGLKFENQINQLGMAQIVKQQPPQDSAGKAPNNMAESADNDKNDDDNELSIVNVGDALSDYISN